MEEIDEFKDFVPNPREFPQLDVPRREHWDIAKKSLVGRLLGVYACGPNADQMGKYDYPEFGWIIRIPLDQIEGIKKEAAARIEELESRVSDLENELDNIYRADSYNL
jgi:hypothetical protein